MFDIQNLHHNIHNTIKNKENEMDGKSITKTEDKGDVILIENKHDIIVIEDDDSDVDQKAVKFPRKVEKPSKKLLTKLKKPKRKVKVARSQDNETLVVTQEVKIKKQKIQCIVNLSNICKHNDKKNFRRPSDLKKNIKLPKPSRVERIIPKCMREVCYKCVYQKSCEIRRKKEELTRRRITKDHTKIKNIKKVKKHKSKVKKRKGVLEGMSPISSSDLDQEVSYDKISSESFHSDSEDELDTLIKRTKERERKLSYSNISYEGNELEFPLHASTPKTETSEGEKTLELSRHELNASRQSVGSVATLVLEPQLEIYSPTNPTSPYRESLNFREIRDVKMEYSDVKMEYSDVKMEYSDVKMESMDHNGNYS